MTVAADPRRALGVEIKRIADLSPLLKKQVARSLGVSPALLSNWFAGRSVPTEQQILRIEEFCHATGESTQLRDLWQRARHHVTDDGDRDALIAFFGADAGTAGISLVYPEFDVGAGRRVPKNGAELHADLAKYPTEVAGSRLRGFGAVVSSHDLDALSFVADLLSEHSIRFRMAVDAEVTRHGAATPLVAFGLQTNAVTTFYLRSASPRLKVFGAIQADVQRVVLPGIGEYESTPPIWRGILARVTPRPERPGRKWFFCAGLGGTGTAVAASYLATYWRDLHDEIGEADFAAVVAGHELAPASAEREALHVLPH